MHEMLHGFSWMHIRARRNQCFDVHRGSAALRHAVGEEHQSVTRLQW